MDKVKTFVKKVHSPNYDVDGNFYLLPNGHFYIELVIDEKTYARELPYKESNVLKEYKDDIINDVAWMSLEDLYEDVMLGVEE